MVRRSPPEDCPSPEGPRIAVLAAGSVVWRIRSASFGPVAFNPTPATDKRQPSRFDPTRAGHGVIYAAETRLAAFAETFLRGETVRGSVVRAVPRRRLAGLRLSRLTTEVDLALVDLVGADGLTRVGQDAWLTACDEEDYPLTQAYGEAIRRWAPTAAGLRWLAKRDNRHVAIVLFDDRVPPDAVTGQIALELDGAGEPYAIRTLARLNVALEDLAP